MLFIALFTHAIALYNRFRSLPESLAREFAAFIALNGGAESLGNSALKHHNAANVFCRQRASGCTWAEHHALVDISREPWAHLFDAIQLRAELPARPTTCLRLHRPTAEQLQDLVVRAQPAVLTGLLDGWPALDRWSNDSYLIEHLGRARVTVSVSEGRFDHPEPPSSWSLPSIEGLRGIVARPAHVPMTLRGALAAMHAVRGGRRQEAADNLTAYVEYQPFDLLLASNEGGSDAASLAAVLSHDLRSNASTGSRSGGSGGSGESERATAAARRIAEAAVASSGAPPIADDGMGNKVYSAPTLTSRGRHEIGALPAAPHGGALGPPPVPVTSAEANAAVEPDATAEARAEPRAEPRAELCAEPRAELRAEPCAKPRAEPCAEQGKHNCVKRGADVCAHTECGTE